MLFKKQSLTSDARQAFGLARNPFDEPQSPEAVYLTPRSRYAREALYDAAINGNLLAWWANPAVAKPPWCARWRPGWPRSTPR